MRKPVDFDQFMEAVREFRMHWLMLNAAFPSAPSPDP